MGEEDGGGKGGAASGGLRSALTSLSPPNQRSERRAMGTSPGVIE